VRRAYDGDPLLSSLVALSDPAATPLAALPDRAQALERLRADEVDFVMLNRAAASPALAAYVDTVLPLTRVGDEGSRSLFVVSRR
jgi:hypothetical protein